MINDLLSLSRMDAGTAKLNLEYVNINELFNHILNRFDMIIKNEAADPSQKKYTIVRYFTKRTCGLKSTPISLPRWSITS